MNIYKHILHLRLATFSVNLTHFNFCILRLGAGPSGFFFGASSVTLASGADLWPDLLPEPCRWKPLPSLFIEMPLSIPGAPATMSSLKVESRTSWRSVPGEASSATLGGFFKDSVLRMSEYWSTSASELKQATWWTTLAISSHLQGLKWKMTRHEAVTTAQ